MKKDTTELKLELQRLRESLNRFGGSEEIYTKKEYDDKFSHEEFEDEEFEDKIISLVMVIVFFLFVLFTGV